MEMKNYDELIAKVKALPQAKRVIVAAAGDEHTLEAIVEAEKEGIVIPVLVGEGGIFANSRLPLKFVHAGDPHPHSLRLDCSG